MYTVMAPPLPPFSPGPPLPPLPPLPPALTHTGLPSMISISPGSPGSPGSPWSPCAPLRPFAMRTAQSILLASNVIGAAEAPDMTGSVVSTVPPRPLYLSAAITSG